MEFLRRAARWAPAICMIGLLAACSSGPDTGRGSSGPIAQPQAQEAGRYKVGRPYEVGGKWYYPKVDYDYRETGIASWYGPKFHGKRTANGEIFDQTRLTAAHRTLPLPSMVRVTNLENGRQVKLRVNDRGPFSRGRIIDVSTRAAELLGFKAKGVAKVRVEIVEGDSRRMAALAKRGSSTRDDRAPAAAPTGSVQTAGLGGGPGSGDSTASNGTLNSEQRAELPPPATDGRVIQVPVGDADIYVQAGAFVRYGNARRLKARLSSLGPSRIQAARVNDRRFFRVQLGPVDTVESADRLLNRLLSQGHPEAQLVVR